MNANGKCKTLAAILATLAAAWSATAGTPAAPARVNGIRVDGAELGEWTHDFDAAAAAAKKAGKPVFANFTGSDWCGWCKLLARQVFTQPEWTAWARQNVFPVHVDFPEDKELVPEKYRERNRELARRYQVRGYPTCLLLDSATLEPMGRFGASRDVDAAGFVSQVASAIPGAAKPAAPARPPASAPAAKPKAKKSLHPFYPAKRRIGKSPDPGFEIRNGTLLGMKSQDAEEVVVPDGVKTVCLDGLVSARTKTVTLPEGVKRISRRSGGYVPGAPLEKLKLPASLEKIDPGALDGHWRRLKTIQIAAGSPYRMEDGFLVDTRDGTLVFALPGRRGLTVPATVKTIGDWAFNANDASKIAIPEGVEKIGRGAFAECRALERIAIPASVGGIGADAFGNCGKLAHVAVSPDNPRYAVRDGFLLDTETATLLRAFGPAARVAIPPEVRTIGEKAFSSRKTLLAATVPPSVRRIEEEAFSFCPNLKELHLPENLDFCGDRIVTGCESLREIRLPAGLTALSGVSSFGRCSSLRELAFPEGLRTIGAAGLGAVCDCASLERISIPASATQIASGAAFMRNPKLKAFEVHPGNPAFRSEDGVLFSRDMTRLVRCPEAKKGNYEIPDTVKRIDAFAFSHCRGLRKIRIPDGVEGAGYGAFKDCPAKLSRTVPVSPAPVAVPAPLPRLAPPTVADVSAGTGSIPRTGPGAVATTNDFKAVLTGVAVVDRNLRDNPGEAVFVPPETKVVVPYGKTALFRVEYDFPEGYGARVWARDGRCEDGKSRSCNLGSNPSGMFKGKGTAYGFLCLLERGKTCRMRELLLRTSAAPELEDSPREWTMAAVPVDVEFLEKPDAADAALAAETPAFVNGVRVDGADLGEWTHDWDAATAAARRDGKPVFVNFTGSDWCGWCRLLRRQVFATPEWGAWASGNVYLVHVDFPKDKSLVPEKYRERNARLRGRYSVGGYPTCFLLDPATLEPLGRFGASKDANPADFIAQISAAMSGAGNQESATGTCGRLPADRLPAGGRIAWFDFSGGNADKARPGRSFECRNVPLADGVLRFNGVYVHGAEGRTNGCNAELRVPELDREGFTVCLSFRPERVRGGDLPLLNFGEANRWFYAHIGTNGRLRFGLNCHDIRLETEGRVADRGWNWLVCSVDVPGRTLRCVLNGVRLDDVPLPEDFGYKDSSKDCLTVDTTYWNAGRAFKGDLGDFLLFDRPLGQDALKALETPANPGAE
ncbi:MAG: leucine-rich repeat protein [Kiritimatiellae bacterium]|nr:leucine-rich repeat protein [Kiritimatiellia bacterium]